MTRAGDQRSAHVEDDKTDVESDAPDEMSFPLEASVGYQIRQTHWFLQRSLQQKILPYGVTLGMWYFLRALWHEDGLTQRELSNITGTMEPTTLMAVRSMERNGLVKRVRNREDRRKINVFLTKRGIALKKELLPLAVDVVNCSVSGFSPRERETFMALLQTMQENLRPLIGENIEEEIE